MPPIKVLHVLARMDFGGAEMRLIEILHRLPADEFRIDVCALSGMPGILDAKVRAHGGEVIPMPLDRRFPVRFLQLLRQRRYSVVHSHVMYTSGPILALAALAGAPMRIAHFRAMHDGRESTLGRRIQRRWMRALINWCASDIVGCGEGSMDSVWLPGWRNDPRCRVIYNTVDPRRFDHPVDRAHVRCDLGIPLEAPLFLHVGNCAPEKNHERLLAIFAAIVAARPSSRLLLVGEGTGDPDGPIAGRIRQLGIGHHVLRLGMRDDVPRLLRASDVLLLPSVREGLPGIVLEACVVGLPAVATDLPGVREIASRLPLVQALPLTASDAEWAAVATGLPAEAERIRLRDTAAEAFRASVFHIDRGVAAHRALWKRAVECS